MFQQPSAEPPVALQSVSARMYNLCDRAVADGVFLVAQLGKQIDGNRAELKQAKEALGNELHCLKVIGFNGRIGYAAVDEYIRQVNLRLTACGYRYQIALSPDHKSCTISDIASKPSRYVSFDCRKKEV
ncbi:MAG TPA: hypothetical protein V6C81_22805 [Planktothrix sp.]